MDGAPLDRAGKGDLTARLGGTVRRGGRRIDPHAYEIESQHFTTIDAFEWSDAFIVNFRRGADQPWHAPAPDIGGWHKDGSYFRHFLDSREQALLTVLLWSEVAPRGGGTFIAPDSVGVIARYLAARPEGASPGAFGDLIHECREFVELTGPPGTLVILHPFMLHASSNNHAGRPRFMSNPPMVLREPFNLQRADAGDYSLLERATLQALGLPRCDFRPAALHPHWAGNAVGAGAAVAQRGTGSGLTLPGLRHHTGAWNGAAAVPPSRRAAYSHS